MSRIILALLALLFLTENEITAQSKRPAVFNFESNQFIKEWLVCGPFPVKGDQNLYTDFLTGQGGESGIHPAAGLSHSGASVPGGKVSWKMVSGSRDGKLDFVKSLEPNQSNIAYAAVTVRCDHKTPALLKLGSNDMLAVWLNGKQIYLYPDPRASGPDVDKVAVDLKKGDNLLLAKVQNVGGGWWLYARFEELFSIDGEVYTTMPVVSGVPKRISSDQIGDVFSIMLFNASDGSAGPVRLMMGKDRKDLAELAEIKPGATVWLNGSSPVSLKDYSGELTANFTVSTPKGENTFRIKQKREPLNDGTTWFLQGFHVDPVWRDSQSGYQALTFSNLSQHLRAAGADPEFDIFISEIPYLKPYYDAYPEDRPLIRNLVREGRIETGGSYNQPNETTISGEAFIRNILYGRLFHEHVLGDSPRVYQPWDVFGHIRQLPQILSKSEFIGTVWERSNYRSASVPVPGIPDLYFAQSPDGTILPTRKLTYGFGDPGGGVASDAEMETRKMMADYLRGQQEQIAGIRYDFRLNATDEKAPSAWMVGRCDIFKTFIPRVRLEADGGQQYFEHVLEQYRNDRLDIPVTSRDVSQYNEGCELSRLDLKLGNRLGENTLIAAEKFATFANVMGMPYPGKALDKAWRQLLYGQHHDGITGCGADVPYLDLTEAYHEALELGGKSLHAALHFIGERTDTRHDDPRAVPVVVYNSLNWQRDDVTKCRVLFDEPVRGFKLVDEQGDEVPCVMDFVEQNGAGVKEVTISFIASGVPSLGYKTYWVIPGASLPPEEIKRPEGQPVIENDFFRMVADEKMGGGIGSLTDKATGKEFIKTENGHPGNEIILLKEGPGFEPAWRFLTTGKKFFSKDYPAEVEVYESPFYQKLVINGDMLRMKKRVQEITLYKGLKRIDFRTYFVDYKGLEGENIIENDKRPRRTDRDFYVVSFPANLNGNVPVLEDRFGTKTYYKSKAYLSYSSTSTEWTTHHAMNSCNQWFDNSYSVVLNFGNENSLALGPVEIVTTKDPELRKAGFRLQTALAQRGVTATPAYPDVQRDYDIQYRRFSFSAGVTGKNSYNKKLLAGLDRASRQTINRQLKDRGYAYAFVYDKDLKEAWFDYPVLMIIGKDEARTRKAVDEITGQLDATGHIVMPAEAWMADGNNPVEPYGLAIINRGNLPVSTEPDGSMVLALMHTIPWQTPLLKWTHDFPERKTHVFDYAVLPHAGNWQDAGVVRAGYDFNNPLIALQMKQHRGVLPAGHSFLSTGNSRCVVSAIKPVTAGNEAFTGTEETSAARGIIVRVYDPEGRPKKIRLNADLKIAGVQNVNLMERKGKDIAFGTDGFEFSISPYSIETFLIRAKTATGIAGSGFDAEPDHPVYTRFWEHNKGAAPLGYAPVNVRILPSPGLNAETSRKNIRQIRIAVTNDLTDSSVSGLVRVETPPGLRAVPAGFAYEVSANSERFYPVAVILEGQVSPGFIRAFIEHDGIELFDALEFRLPGKQFGHAENPDRDEMRIRWTVSRDQDRVVVNLSNPFLQPVDGEVAMIGPVETWGDCTENTFGLSRVTPWKKAFHILAGGKKTLYFDIQSLPGRADSALWLAAKLSYFGYLDYKPAAGSLEIKEEL